MLLRYLEFANIHKLSQLSVLALCFLHGYCIETILKSMLETIQFSDFPHVENVFHMPHITNSAIKTAIEFPK